VAGYEGLGGFCASVGDVLTKAGHSPLLYTVDVVRLSNDVDDALRACFTAVSWAHHVQVVSSSSSSHSKARFESLGAFRIQCSANATRWGEPRSEPRD